MLNVAYHEVAESPRRRVIRLGTVRMAAKPRAKSGRGRRQTLSLSRLRSFGFPVSTAASMFQSLFTPATFRPGEVSPLAAETGSILGFTTSSIF